MQHAVVLMLMCILDNLKLHAGSFVFFNNCSRPFKVGSHAPCYMMSFEKLVLDCLKLHLYGCVTVDCLTARLFDCMT